MSKRILTITLLILTLVLTSCAGKPAPADTPDTSGRTNDENNVMQEDYYEPVRVFNESVVDRDWDKMVSVNPCVALSYVKGCDGDLEAAVEAFKSGESEVVTTVSIDGTTHYASRDEVLDYIDSLDDARGDNILTAAEYFGLDWDNVREAYIIYVHEQNNFGDDYNIDYFVCNFGGKWYICDENITDL